jgi:hypothetical protein
MKIKILYTITFVSFFGIALADDTDSTKDVNNILFLKDPRIDVLEKIYTYKKTVKVKLIKVHVFQASNRDAVFEAKNDFSKRFPGIPTFVSYQAPNFKLRAGEFETTQEAQNFLKQVKPHFKSSFVIEENTPTPKK